MQASRSDSAEFPAEPVTPIDRIRAEQVKVLYRNGPSGILTSLGTAFVLAGVLVYVGGLQLVTAATFLTAILANTVICMVLMRRYWQAAPAAADWPIWAQRFTATAGLAHL